MSKKFILGTVQFGLTYGINNKEGHLSKEKVFDILDFAFDEGIKTLDSANAYGNAQEMVGEFIGTSGKKFKVNTKFHVQNEKSISEQLNNTLHQLAIDKVNVYFFHRFEDFKNSNAALASLKEFKKQNKISQTGVSVYTNEELEACIYHSEVDVIQLPFNLLDNGSKRGSLIKKAKQNGKELQVRSVFLQGLFFKDEKTWPPYLLPLLSYVQLLKEIAAASNLSMFDLALGYVMAHADIDSIIIGVDSKDQLKKNLEAGKRKLDEALIKKIDAISVKEESLLYPYNWK